MRVQEREKLHAYRSAVRRHNANEVCVCVCVCVCVSGMEWREAIWWFLVEVLLTVRIVCSAGVVTPGRMCSGRIHIHEEDSPEEQSHVCVELCIENANLGPGGGSESLM